jgi:hypothetical protein
MGPALFIEAQIKEMSVYPVIYELEWNLLVHCFEMGDSRAEEKKIVLLDWPGQTYHITPAIQAG